jgi:hypothetical protein
MHAFSEAVYKFTCRGAAVVRRTPYAPPTHTAPGDVALHDASSYAV